jgi:hypothetical protein
MVQGYKGGEMITKWPDKPGNVKRVVFQHYRVPDDMVMPRIKGWPDPKGEPSERILFHYRKGVDRWTPSLFGGKTVCMIETTDGWFKTAEAMCSLSDPFSYKVGREIAYTRALEMALNVQ